jgi:hypothetical protein
LNGAILEAPINQLNSKIMNKNIFSGETDFEKIFDEINEIMEKNFSFEKITKDRDPSRTSEIDRFIYTFESFPIKIIVTVPIIPKYLRSRFGPTRITIVYDSYNTHIFRDIKSKELLSEFIQILKEIFEFGVKSKPNNKIAYNRLTKG